MFRNYLAAALRNLVRNRLYAAINIVGLAVGFAAALLIALYVRDELSYDRWIPGHENIFRVAQGLMYRGTPLTADSADPEVRDWIAAEIPDVEAVTRLS